ncbi:hypothetical protein EJ08DRAFT_336968 [Tothia fuscella]|uniref:Uncharacterized protein n=1 Tax=Tothia fuscella TaxID=1048955 RepID=A0A9P4NZK9_9PEZI|nr:hypothetical protein EJ08DRAFT_336968 [Tothia fuscella]
MFNCADHAVKVVTEHTYKLTEGKDLVRKLLEVTKRNLPRMRADAEMRFKEHSKINCRSFHALCTKRGDHTIRRKEGADQRIDCNADYSKTIEKCLSSMFIYLAGSSLADIDSQNASQIAKLFDRLLGSVIAAITDLAEDPNTLKSSPTLRTYILTMLIYLVRKFETLKRETLETIRTMIRSNTFEGEYTKLAMDHAYKNATQVPGGRDNEKFSHQKECVLAGLTGSLLNPPEAVHAQHKDLCVKHGLSEPSEATSQDSKIKVEKMETSNYADDDSLLVPGPNGQKRKYEE